MTRFPRCRAEWHYAAICLLLLSSFIPVSSSNAGDNQFNTGFSDHLLVPENPYIFVNSVTFWKGFRHDRLEPGAPAGKFDLFQLGLETDLHWDKLNVLGSASWGWDGGEDAQSADYLAGLGYDFDLTVTGIQLTPVAGWAGSHLDCDARFDTEWAGPFAGFKLEIPLAEKWLIEASYRYRWAAFEAVLPTTVNRADAGGHVGRLDLIYQFRNRVDLKLGTEYQSLSSDPGSISRTEADWESWNVQFGVSFKF